MKKPKKNKPQAPGPAKSSGDTASFSAPAASASSSPSPKSREPRVVVRDVGGEPVATRASLPVLLIALLAALIYFGDAYVIDHGGELDARVHQPFHIVKDLDDLVPKDPVEILKAQGRQSFSLMCAGCHQADGMGAAAQDYPPLAGSDWVQAKDPSRIIRIALNGLSGPITVSGKAYGRGVMFNVGAGMSDEQLANTLTYVRNSWGNKAPAVTPDQVKKIRGEVKDRASGWTADELMNIPLKN